MKTTISKRDGKKYFKTIAKFSSSADARNAFIEGNNYWVRKADESDNIDVDTYCIIKGTFNNASDSMKYALNRNAINKYEGTYYFKLIVPKNVASLVLNYCD